MIDNLISTIDARKETSVEFLNEILQKLSSEGDVVSEAGREKTIAVFGEPLSPNEVVRRICSDVKEGGLARILHYSKAIDNVELDSQSIRLSNSEVESAHGDADDDFKQTVREIRSNIMHFQASIRHQDVEVTRGSGIELLHRYLPMNRVGVCVPGGAAAYPSTVLMTAVLAQVAGVKEIVIVAPPTQYGANNIDVLATCHEIGVKEIYRIGGAQAVAALAYGAEGIAPVDMIVGPGNLFVALAKKFVFGQVDIDSIAGPSEVLLIAGDDADPRFVASDLLAQAEHSPGASLLLSWNAQQIEQVRKEIESQLASLSRAELTARSLADFGCLIQVRDAEQAVQIANTIAPEHLHVVSDQLGSIVPDLVNAGAIFVGNFTPVALGDYVAGPSHVLPTSGTARWASGLSVNDFLRHQTVVQYDRKSLQADADNLRIIANKEGLTAHRKSVDIRLES